jgi:hypothetical protein
MKFFVTGVWLVVAAAGFGPSPAIAATPPVEIRWNELAALIVGRHVSIALPGRILIEGEALSVRDETLLLDIGKTSSAQRYPKGQTPVPRVELTEVRVTERRGTGGRVLATAIGGLTGMVAGGEIAAHGTGFRSEGVIVSTFTATAVALTVAGYLVGRHADQHTRLLLIAPTPGGGQK